MIAHAHYAALDVLRSGSNAAAAHRAAASSLRPGGVLDWLETGIARRAVETAIEEVNMSNFKVDYFEIAKDIARDNLADINKARGELAHMITVFGPVAVAQAAKIGLERRGIEDTGP